MKTSNQDIKAFVNDVCLSAHNVLGKRCLSVYIMGSLARGGFSEVASDIDMGVILRELRDDDASIISDIQFSVRQRHPRISNNLSVFWGTIGTVNGARNGGRYPPFDRLDLIDHALLLFGAEVRDQLLRPTREELEMASAQFAIDYLGTRERIHEFSNCELITGKGVVYVTKTVLFPARFIFLAKTGAIAGNDVSSQYYVDHFSGSDAELVASAYHWRFNSLPENLDAVTRQIGEGIGRLYHNFIDIYSERMEFYGRHDLAFRLMQWKEEADAS